MPEEKNDSTTVNVSHTLRAASHLNPHEFDAIREVGNVGVGNATTALSRLVNKKIAISIPQTKFVPLEKMAYEIGGPERIITGLYLNFSGDLSGECLFAFSEQSACELVDLMMGNPSGTTHQLGEIEESAFKEMSNIFTGAYLSSLANMLSMKALPSVPAIAVDMAQAVIDLLLIRMSRVANEILVVSTCIRIEEHAIDGTFILLFTPESLERILSFLEKNYYLER